MLLTLLITLLCISYRKEMRYKRRKFSIVCSYDTETTNFGEGSETIAFPVLFIDNDLRDIDLYNYEPDVDDTINFYRTEQEMEEKIKEYILYGKAIKRVPIICAYNLMFDLQPMMEYLNGEYDIRVNAQSSTNVYTVDLYEQETDNMLLRFWDTYHLEMRGLKAMGETAGLPKAVGDWDYSLIRTPETPLSEEELFYAGRDTQVIPMYLRYLLHANEWLKQDDLGNRVLTKTSIVRQMARKQIGSLYVDKKDCKKLSLDKAFIEKCLAQRPKTFGQYALRKACFRGGFTFTAAATANQIVHNVVSLDVTSMHHTFINGRFIPEDFTIRDNKEIEVICNQILKTSTEYILEHYERPFLNAIHARIWFKNIRIRKGTCFDKWGIALESTSKFKSQVIAGIDIGQDPRATTQENEVRSYGWYDTMKNGKCAFGKMYAADECILNLSELELWCVSRVYEWDKMEVLIGEATGKFRTPPDFVTLQSNELFEMKSRAKFISKHYTEGLPYEYNLTGIPDGIAEELRNGTCPAQFFDSWYTGTVKGMFNGIYGTMAQDVYKPSYKCENGELIVDETTKTTPFNFDEKNDMNTLRVLYTYGLRIVGGSRMHMVLAMEMLYKAMKNRVKVLGGDTDSMKVSCAFNVTDEELDEALKPIAEASKEAITKTMARLRKTFPTKASSLKDIGAFDIENRGKHYETHIELWNKCRVSYDGKAHVTAAGLPRPIGIVNIETVITELAKKYNIEDVLQLCIGYNVYVDNSVSHILESNAPKPYDKVDIDVTDWSGATRHVTSHQSRALWSSGRWLGETLKFTNASTVAYLRDAYNRDVNTNCRYISYDKTNGIIYVKGDTEDGIKVLMECNYA